MDHDRQCMINLFTCIPYDDKENNPLCSLNYWLKILNTNRLEPINKNSTNV